MGHHQSSSVAATALVFGAAGFLAGVLLAPKSGRETRQQIATKSNEIKNKATERAAELKDTTRSAAHRIRNVASDTTNETRNTVRRAREDAENSLDNK